MIEGIEVGHGAGTSPDGTRIYVSNESVVDVKAMKEVARIPVGFVPKRTVTGMLQY